MESKMQLTKRDIEMIRFINEFGFCEMPQFMKRFGLKKTWMYEMMQRLIEAGFIKHQRILHGRPGVYSVTRKGAKLTDLPPIEQVTVGRYEHQNCVLNVYMKLREQYPEAHWISERRLMNDKFCDGLGKTGHVSDGILMFPDGKQIAIEVELSIKGKNRIEKILRGYGAQLSIKEVWYYCTPPVASLLKRLSANMPFIKTYHLREFLNDQ